MFPITRCLAPLTRPFSTTSQPVLKGLQVTFFNFPNQLELQKHFEKFQSLRVTKFQERLLIEKIARSLTHLKILPTQVSVVVDAEVNKAQMEENSMCLHLNIAPSTEALDPNLVAIRNNVLEALEQYPQETITLPK